MPNGWGALEKEARAWRPRPLPAGDGAEDDDALVDLVPMLRRVVGSRVKDPHTVDDLVQEALMRVMAARSRVEPGQAAPLRGA